MIDSRPNILWLMTDEQRADSLGYAGTPWAHTPNLDRLALAGSRFNAAYTPSPVCVPARACLLTGRACSSIGVMNNHHWLNLDNPHFLSWLFAAAGYQTASFGKRHYGSPRRAFDLEGGQVLGDLVDYCAYKAPVDAEQAGVVRYEGGKTPWLFAGRFPGTVDETPEMNNVRQAVEWIKGRDPNRPYLLRISFNAPHTPVVTPAPFDTMIDPKTIDLPSSIEAPSETVRDFLQAYAGTQRLTDAQLDRARQCYYGHVAFVDHAFGYLLEALEAVSELENTIVAFISDHGCHLGEHGFMQKQSFGEVSARVPFFVQGPGIQSQTLSTPVNAGSLLPTLLDLVGLDIPEWVQFPSLASALTGDAPCPNEPVFSEIDYGLWHYRDGERYVMVRDGRWKLSMYRDPIGAAGFSKNEDRVLFDLENDPEERHNLADDPAHQEMINHLIAKIDAWDKQRPIVPVSPTTRHVQERNNHDR